MHPDHQIPESAKKPAPLPLVLPKKPRVRSPKLESLADVRRQAKRLYAEFRCPEGPLIGPDEMRASLGALTLIMRTLLAEQREAERAMPERQKPAPRTAGGNSTPPSQPAVPPPAANPRIPARFIVPKNMAPRGQQDSTLLPASEPASSPRAASPADSLASAKALARSPSRTGEGVPVACAATRFESTRRCSRNRQVNAELAIRAQSLNHRCGKKCLASSARPAPSAASACARYQQHRTGEGRPGRMRRLVEHTFLPNKTGLSTRLFRRSQNTSAWDGKENRSSNPASRTKIRVPLKSPSALLGEDWRSGKPLNPEPETRNRCSDPTPSATILPCLRSDFVRSVPPFVCDPLGGLRASLPSP
jgi:hypothetical protein